MKTKGVSTRQRNGGKKGKEICFSNTHSGASYSRPVQYTWAKLTYQTIGDDTGRIGEMISNDGLS